MVLLIPVVSRAQVLTDGSNVHIDHALNLIMVDLGGGFQMHQFHHRIESGWEFRVGRAQWNLLQVEQVVDGGLPCSAYCTLRK